MVVQPGEPTYWVRAEVNVLTEKLFDELAEAVGFGELGDLVAKLEVLKDVLNVRRETVEVVYEVVSERLLRLTGLEVA